MNFYKVLITVLDMGFQTEIVFLYELLVKFYRVFGISDAETFHSVNSTAKLLPPHTHTHTQENVADCYYNNNNGRERRSSFFADPYEIIFLRAAAVSAASIPVITHWNVARLYSLCCCCCDRAISTYNPDGFQQLYFLPNYIYIYSTLSIIWFNCQLPTYVVPCSIAFHHHHGSADRGTLYRLSFSF